MTTTDDVESGSDGNDADSRLSDRLGTTDITIDHYRLPPGTEFPGGLHAHADQEEVFVVIEGEATFDVLTPGSKRGQRITVDADEAVRFAPGSEFHSGKNESGGDLVALAIGAPHDSEDMRIPMDCPECSHSGMRVDAGEDGTAFICPNCEAECVPQACPECGREEMRFALVEDGLAVVVCPDCRAEFERPPVRK